MGQLLRMHRGKLSIDVGLLQDIEWVLEMDSAADRGQVVAVMDRARAIRDAGGEPESDMDLIVDGELLHDWLSPFEVDAVQQLRGWHRLRHGRITVDAAALSAVHNLLDTAVLSGMRDCEELAEELEGQPGCEDELAVVTARIAAGGACYRCTHCQMLVLRDRISAALDTAGFEPSSAYRAYVTRAGDSEALWREQVVGPLAGPA